MSRNIETAGKVVLVTGGAGFIGSQLTRKLHAAGCRVIVVDDLRNYPAHPDILAQIKSLQSAGDIQWLECSIEKAIPQLLRSYAPGKIDLICHLAAMPGVRAVEAAPDASQKNNIEETHALLAFSDTANIRRILFASSSSVYGSCEGPVAESAPCSPVSLYARQKVLIEQALQKRAEKQRIVVARLFSVYGPGIRPDLVFYSILERLVDGGIFTLFGDGSQERDWTYIDDAVCALMKLVQTSFARDENEFAIWNIGAEQPRNLATAIRKLESLAGHSLNIQHEKAVTFEPLTTFADCTRLRELGWNPQVDLDTGLQRLYEWFVAAKKVPDANPN